ncbi:iron hydrogenase 1 [Anaerotignum neopropionicum]|uniref:Iron hydrogenase 1 n=1 Tax=Anaerotignum neopropionicum TaxID=36847 RepID=A0A136WE44_9FIRM|nr:4Fe-4S dicluster domain-containing protein [Anaerotignum neopropionicum]KXL52785.1 iron hydrogenase 1 [Anaerotignum neopropionicum]
MKEFESNVQYIKYLVIKEVAQRFFHGTLDKSINSYREIAEAIIPGPKAMFRCCIYKERHIIEERVHLVLEPTKDNRIINVLSSACDECPIDRFVVTEACRGCLGHKCQEVCPRNAITIVNHRSYINQALCIECGRCKQVCPFNAISEVKRPCIRSCPVGAVQINEEKKAFIDHEKCITCGACVYQCPFGAIVDKSFVLNILDLIQNSWNNTSYHVYAIVAPAIASQFPEVKMGQVFAAIKDLGFYDVIEAAIGGDMVAVQETKEFAETIDEKGWKTTSCCPAFVDYIQRNYPQFMDHVSTTVSPMIALARAIHKKDKKAKIVFIGPCIAKKDEIKHEDLVGAVDFVLTFEELKAMFDAKELNLEELEERSAGAPSGFGRIFGRTGGVAESVIKVAQMEGIEKEIKPIYCNGIDECIKNMKLASFGKLNANFLEGMACKNGCTGGAASLSHDQRGIELLNRYGKEAATESPFEGIAEYDLTAINMERRFGLQEK